MSVKQLKQYCKSVNVAAELDDELLNKIGQQVLLGFQEDEKSNQEWLADIRRVEELASLKTVKKSTPLPNSANIKLPLITKACYEFSSRVHPEIVKDDKIVKPRIVGKEKDTFKSLMGQRVADFMNYYLLFRDNKWQMSLNKLLVRLALIGFICKKTYYDPIRKEIKQIVCKPDELIIHADSSSLEEAARISHVLHLKMNDLVEHMNVKEDDVSLFLETPVKELMEERKDDNLNCDIDVIEQCTYLDLDEDGYLEPYIVTVLKSNGKVLRIVTQFEEEDIFSERKDEVCYINKCEVYEDFHFLPNPKGTFQSVGFGILLLHINESSNSIMNQLLDSAQLANMKGGYMDARLKQLGTGNSLHDAGEFKLVKVDPGLVLKDGILPLQYNEPSSVMYQLLGLLMDVARDLTSSAEVNNGTQSSENAKTGATLALQAEGRKVANSINKSIYNSMAKEFKHIFKIMGKDLSQDEYANVLDDPLANIKKDFDPKTVDVLPIADPTLSSEQQRYAQAAAIQSLMGLPGVDPVKATKLILERVSIPGIEKILADENAEKQPNLEMLKFQAETEGHAQELNLKGAELDIKEKDLLIRAHLAEAQVEQMKANAIALIAKAESEPAKIQLEQYRAYLDTLSKKIETDLSIADMQMNKQSQELGAQNAPQPTIDPSQGLGGMAGESGDQGITPPPV